VNILILTVVCYSALLFVCPIVTTPQERGIFGYRFLEGNTGAELMKALRERLAFLVGFLSNEVHKLQAQRAQRPVSALSPRSRQSRGASVQAGSPAEHKSPLMQSRGSRADVRDQDTWPVSADSEPLARMETRLALFRAMGLWLQERRVPVSTWLAEQGDRLPDDYAPLKLVSLLSADEAAGVPSPLDPSRRGLWLDLVDRLELIKAVGT